MSAVTELISRIQAKAKPENSSKRVIVGMSGGVDSSVSAYLLQLQGYQVEGVFMKNWEDDDGTEYCTAAKDLADAEAVSNQLGIKLHKINFASEYWDNVFENFLSEFSKGRTPNPDILCNREIKFKVFLEYAFEDLGADYLATGHYCRCDQLSDDSWAMKRGLDNNKDQTYFLYTLKDRILEKVLFPVGELTKPEVRLIAEHLNLKTAKKKDSTGICFIGERRFSDFLANYLPATEGDIINLDTNQVLGKHHGSIYYTIGQRKGLGIGGIKGHEDSGWYVVDKDVQRNIVYVVDRANHPALHTQKILLKDVSVINQEQFNSLFTSDGKANVTCKVRYRAVDVDCTLQYFDNDTLLVTFDQPVQAVTPGQSAVFYSGEYCLGGGIIDKLLT